MSVKGNTFNIVGKIVPLKDKGNFKHLEERTTDSGWNFKTLKYNVISGSNSFFMENNVGYKPDGSGNVYTSLKGKDGKYANAQVPWNKRKDKSIIEKAAPYRIFSVDLEPNQNRKRALQSLVDKYKKDPSSVKTEELEAVGVITAAELEKELEAIKKKKHEFLHEVDFIDFMEKFSHTSTCKDNLFLVKGKIEYQYSAKTGKFYEKKKVEKVQMLDSTAEIRNSSAIEFFFDDNGVVENEDEPDKIAVNGYVKQYLSDKDFKGEVFVPYPLVIRKGTDDDPAKQIKCNKAFERITGIFRQGDDKPHSTELIVKLVDGYDYVRFTEDDLSEDQLEDIELGLADLEDVLREMNRKNTVSDERITENRLAKFKTTPIVVNTFEDADFSNPQLNKGKEVENVVETSEDDLFDDDLFA